MNVESITKREIFDMVVDGEEYHRYSAKSWTTTSYFDIMSEEYGVIDEFAEKLEAAFQEHKELI